MGRQRSEALLVLAAAAVFVHWLPAALLLLAFVALTPGGVDRPALALGIVVTAGLAVALMVASPWPLGLMASGGVAVLLLAPALLRPRLRVDAWQSIATGFAIGVGANLVMALLGSGSGPILPIRGFAAHQNTLGALVALATPFVLALAVTRGGAARVLGFVACLSALGLTGSRSALIALAASVLVLALLGLAPGSGRGASPTRFARIWFVAGVGALLLVGFVWWAVRQPTPDEVTGLTGRETIWGVAAEMVLERPLFGHGPRAWADNVARFEPSLSALRTPHPHNGLLTLALEVGLFGLCYTAFYVAALAAGLLADARRRGGVAAAACAVFTAFLAVNLTDSFVTDLRFVLIVMMVWASAAATLPPPSAPGTDRKRSHPAP
ncbi:MAG: O-antigen ligase family protein [Trueperaceae bacterium]|nr:O-antigen ligase family protein [Trueperaceae bacterium]